jgi:hypothetical protein
MKTYSKHCYCQPHSEDISQYSHFLLH